MEHRKVVNLLIGLVGTNKYGDIYNIASFRIFMLNKKFVKDTTVDEYVNSNIYVAGLSEIDKRVLSGSLVYNFKTMRLSSNANSLFENIGKLPVYEKNTIINDANNSKDLDCLEFKIKPSNYKLAELRLIFDILKREYRICYDGYDIVDGSEICTSKYNIHCYCYRLYDYLSNQKLIDTKIDNGLLMYGSIAIYFGSDSNKCIELPRECKIFNLDCNKIADSLEAIVLSPNLKALKLQGDLTKLSSVRLYVYRNINVSTVVEFAFDILYWFRTDGYCSAYPKLAKLYGEERFKYRIKSVRARLTKYRTTPKIFNNKIDALVKRLKSIGFNIELI